MAKKDKVRPLKIENPVDGTEDDQGYYTQADPSEDYLSAKGIVFENDDDQYITIVSGEIAFSDKISGIQPLSDVISGGSHKDFDYLGHNISEDSYIEVTRSGGLISNICYYTDAGKSTKIREHAVSRSGIRVSQVVTTQYDGAGSPSSTYTETVVRDGDGRFLYTSGVISG